MTRREPAIRDFYDVDRALKANMDIDAPHFVHMVRKKLELADHPIADFTRLPVWLHEQRNGNRATTGTESCRLCRL